MTTTHVPHSTSPTPAPTVTPAEAADPHCLSPEEGRLLLRSAPWRRLAVMGDSIAAGVGDPTPGHPDRRWADRLAYELGAARGDVVYRNLGFPGLLAAEVRAQQLDEALAFEPDLVVLTAGGNDMLAPTFDAEAVASELDVVVGALRRAGATVVTFGLLDLSRASFVPESMRADLHERLRLLGDTTAAVSARHHGIHVDFFDHPAAGDDSIYSADLIHPNRRGQAIVLAETVRALGRHLRPS